MKQELIIIADKIESIKCKTHTEVAKIKIVRDKIQISCCCEEHKQFLERQVEYEIYKIYHKGDKEQRAALPILKEAV